ncbi:hypothetical protein AQUCO_00200959v1 [Aquilegia coerulea]|uniref:SGNH hydrolase-type esterase domain-containing protein n=1 Tax=Aquilegia coerulea TaxID=218851 RepID=A0A2G5F5S2_AQUCA|nr:hypothetical protein AQUCO_00200959v1 [Aquilegia coerulea]
MKSAAPAIYVFGDSLVDCGNNNNIQTFVKVNYPPYGIDFVGGATGRFTNGKTIPDITAEILGLPMPPAYKSLNLSSFKNLTGVNYASGGGGILPETGRNFGKVITFGQQISYFQTTVEQVLQPQFGNLEDLQKYLSKSIFMIAIGSNDYINNYLQPQYYDTSRSYTPLTFAQLLMKRFSRLFERLYKLGARKVVMYELNPLGCIPRYRTKPNEKCVEEYNDLARNFNSHLNQTLERLTHFHPGTIFTKAQLYEGTKAMIENPSKFGFNDVKHPCCYTGDSYQTCIRGLPPCQNSSQHLWWDGFHGTENSYSLIANGCYNGSAPCSPINIDQLMRA